MENIGKFLKEKRIELGLSVEDIGKKTRLTSKHIKALEAGDISFFDNDLSYLRFFVKSYCEAVDVDFNDIKDELRTSIDDYTMTSMTNMQLSHDEIERNIAKSEKLTKVQSANVKVRRKRIARKPDFSLVSLVAIIGVVILVIVFALVVYLRSDAGKSDNESAGIPTAPVQEGTGTNKNPTNESEPEPEPVKKEIEIKRIDPADGTRYLIQNLNEGDDLKIETTFNGSNSYYSVTSGADVYNNKLFDYKATATTDLKATKGMKVTVYIGYLYNVEVKINGKVIKLDDAMQNSKTSYMIDFTVGENNESAQ